MQVILLEACFTEKFWSRQKRFRSVDSEMAAQLHSEGVLEQVFVKVLHPYGSFGAEIHRRDVEGACNQQYGQRTASSLSE